MSLPSPLLDVPSLSDYQLFFQGPAATGVTMGPSTPFGLKKIEGIDKAPVRKGNTNRPRFPGSYIGINLLDERDVTLTMDVGPFASDFGGYGSLQAALAALRATVDTEGTTEYPFWLQIPNSPLLCMMCRVDKETIPLDIVYSLGNMAQNVPIQFESTDPYWYAAPTLNPSCGLPTPGIGFTFDIDFNLSFGGGSSANTITATNNGDVACYPTLVITGPCLNPTIQNSSISGAPFLTLDIQLNSGDMLVIDCNMQTVTYFPSGSTVGANRFNTLQPGFTFFTIQPGANVVSFNSQDITPVAGTLSVWYTSTYSSVT